MVRSIVLEFEHRLRRTSAVSRAKAKSHSFFQFARESRSFEGGKEKGKKACSTKPNIRIHSRNETTL